VESLLAEQKATQEAREAAEQAIAIRGSLEAEIEELDSRLTASESGREQLTAELERVVAKRDQRIQAFEETLDRRQLAHEQAVQELQQNREQALQALRQDYEEALQQLQQEHEQVLAAMTAERRELQNALDTEQKASAKAVARLERTVVKEQEGHAKAIERLEGELKAAQNRLEDQRREADYVVQQSLEQLASLQAENTTLAEQLTTIQSTRDEVLDQWLLLQLKLNGLDHWVEEMHAEMQETQQKLQN